MPKVLATAADEIWQSCSLGFSLCSLLTHGAVEALLLHGSDELQNTYLPKLISGEWTGTMNLTEPQAGSDLAAVNTRAVPDGDHYLITGQKIFITWGDHQMTDNVIHLVLARLPDAPAGVKGISLFLVPKFLLDDNSQPSKRNDVHCVSLEHKLPRPMQSSHSETLSESKTSVAIPNRSSKCSLRQPYFVDIFCRYRRIKSVRRRISRVSVALDTHDELPRPPGLVPSSK